MIHLALCLLRGSQCKFFFIYTEFTEDTQLVPIYRESCTEKAQRFTEKIKEHVTIYYFQCYLKKAKFAINK